MLTLQRRPRCQRLQLKATEENHDFPAKGTVADIKKNMASSVPGVVIPARPGMLQPRVCTQDLHQLFLPQQRKIEDYEAVSKRGYRHFYVRSQNISRSHQGNSKSYSLRGQSERKLEPEERRLDATHASGKPVKPLLFAEETVVCGASRAGHLLVDRRTTPTALARIFQPQLAHGNNPMK